jgi:hypothetical protein
MVGYNFGAVFESGSLAVDCASLERTAVFNKTIRVSHGTSVI